VDLREAYALARGMVRMQPDALGGQVGHHLFWVRGGAFGKTTLVARSDAFAIIGRHTQCKIVLPDDPFVALRHVLVRSLALPSGGVALRILDLHTSLGFVLADGSRQSSVLVEGPTAVAIGEYALIGLPTETPNDQLPEHLPPPRVEMPTSVREQMAALENAMSPYRANATSERNRTSHFTLMPRLVMMGEPIPPRLGRLATGGAWSITLDRGRRSATMNVSEEDLAGGVVIGRSEKCHAENLRRITDTGTSRVHVLLLREGSDVVAYDLASTQGTWVGHRPAHRVALDPNGTILTLGRGENAVRMTWRAAAG
jgi:hypothetical protein